MSSSHEIYLENNSLVVIVKMCLGHTTCVELRDESHVIGKIVEVDGFMNVTLENARYFDPKRNSQRFDSFFVQNRLIRFVQIPKEINIRESLKRRFDPSFRGRGRGRGRELAISGSKKKILAMRSKRRQEDLENAMKLKREEDERKKDNK